MAVAPERAIVELSETAAKNGYLVLRGVDWVPEAVIGGSNKASAAEQLLTVAFSDGEATESDIAGDKMMLRARGAVRKFYEAAGLKAGDKVLVERTGPFEIRISPAGAEAAPAPATEAPKPAPAAPPPPQEVAAEPKPAPVKPEPAKAEPAKPEPAKAKAKPAAKPAPAASAAEARLRACPLCLSPRRKSLGEYSRRGWIVAECRDCGFVYLSNPPAGDALEAEEHAWEESSAGEETRRKAAAPLVYQLDYATRWRNALFRPDEMGQFKSWFGSGGNILDVGCADGTRVRPPFVPFGIEVSKALAAKADAHMRAHGGYCVQGTGAEKIAEFPEAHFDGIVMRSYLEHETEPRRALAAARRAMKPSGKIYVKVPNYGSINRWVMGRNWCGFRHPDHVNYFTPASLESMVRKEGFGMRILNRFNLILDDNIHALLRRI
ncbi:MAG: methyltransferase domain-containing protein [Pseudomonadota bacterium]